MREVNALVSTVKSCAQSILETFARQAGSDLTKHDVLAACVLARKTTLGYDAENLVAAAGDGKYDAWIVEHLRRNNWKACEDVQRSVGELPAPAAEGRNAAIPLD